MIHYRVIGHFETVSDQALKNEITAHPSRAYLKAVITGIGQKKFS